MISSLLPCLRPSKAISFFVCLFAINFAAAQTPTLTTDQPDYPPGSTVIITGSGFAAGDTVRLQVVHVGAGDNETSGAHAPWIEVADDNGSFTTTWIVPLDEDELGATLLATADGQTSGLHAETTFTDATNDVNSISITATQSAAVTYGSSSSVTYLITITPTGQNGNGNVTLSLTGTALPTGASAVFTPGANVSLPSGSTTNITVTLTITNSIVTPKTPAGTTSGITVRVSSSPPKTTNTFSYVVNKRAITVTSETNSKTYDGTTSASAIPQITSGSLAGTDAATFTETYGNKNVGTGITLTPSGIVNDGNSGNNYAYTFVNDNTGVINARALTITAAATTRVYDGTTSSATAPTVAGGIQTGDVAAFIEVYDNRNIGANKTLTPSGNVNDGNSGNNYTYSFVTANTGAITARPLTITGAPSTKVYDGTTASSSIPTVTGGVEPTDVANFTQVYDNKNVGTGKTLIPSGSVNDGNGGNNYTYTFNNLTTGPNRAITARPITITADPKSKTYGEADPALTAQVTSGTIVSGDVTTGSLIRVSGENVGTYQISQGTYTYGSNYAETYVPANLTITQRAITITADLKSKTYGDADPTLTAQVTSGTIVSGDVATGSLKRVSGENVGTYQINHDTYTYGSNYAETYVPANLTITQASTYVPVTSASVQHSDQVTLVATVTSPTAQSEVNSTGGTVIFKIQPSGGGTITTLGTSSYPGDWSSANGTATKTFTILQAPGTYTIIACFTPNSGNLSGSTNSNAGTLKVTPEDACPNYNGDFFVNSDITTGAFTVKLKLALTDNPDGFKGNISNAQVKFIVTDNGTPVQGSPFTATMDASSLSLDNTLAWFGATFTGSLGTSCLSKTYDIKWTISNYYQDGGASVTSNCVGSDLGAEVTVSSPTSDFITGGGYIVLDNTATGKYTGDVGSKNNFGFNVKWNKSLTNIQGGGINTIVRKGTHQYQVKGTKVTALSVAPANGTTPATASFTCNAVVNDIVNNVVVYSEGNCAAIVEITDVCEPGSGVPTSSDLIAITVKDKNGVVVYSNHWVSTKSVKVPLNGGNLQIHSGNSTGAPKCGLSSSTRADITARQPESTIVMNKFDLKAFPNPSKSQFTLKIESDNTKDQINIKVTDILGRTIQTYTNLSAGQTLNIGSNYKVGIYLIEMIQGNMHKQLKLIKQ